MNSNKRYIKHLVVSIGGYSFAWLVIFITIKLVASDIAYGQFEIQNELAATISAYAFEVMFGIWLCGIIVTLIFQWRKLLRVMEHQEQDAQRKKNEMLAYLAHDLRTPLTSILGYVHILEQMDSRDTDEAREYLNMFRF